MRELLAMLSARTVDLGGVSFGGAVITPQMVSAALHVLPTEVQLYARLKYSLDDSVAAELYDRHYLDTVNLGFRNGWRLKESESATTVGKLSDLALRESITPHICSVCNGAGMLNNKGACKVCDGTGVGAELSIRKIAVKLDVSKHRAEHFWRDKLRLLCSNHAQWESDIDKALKKLTSDNSGG